MYPGQLQRRRRLPVERNNGADGALHPQQSRRTIEDIGALVQRRQVYVIGNPGEGMPRSSPPYPATPADFADAEAEAAVRRARARLEPRFSKNWFASANYTLSRLYGNYSGIAPTRTKSARRRPGVSSTRAAAGRQHRPRRAATRNRPGTSTSCCGIRTGTSTSSADWPPIVRTS